MDTKDIKYLSTVYVMIALAIQVAGNLIYIFIFPKQDIVLGTSLLILGLGICFYGIIYKSMSIGLFLGFISFWINLFAHEILDITTPNVLNHASLYGVYTLIHWVITISIAYDATFIKEKDYYVTYKSDGELTSKVYSIKAKNISRELIEKIEALVREEEGEKKIINILSVTPLAEE